MRYFFIFLAALLFLSVPTAYGVEENNLSDAPEDSEFNSIGDDYSLIGDRVSKIDLDISLGYPLQGQNTLFVRGRIGKMWVRGAWIRSLGAAIRVNTPIGWIAGVEAETIFLPSGLWASGGFGWAQSDRLVGYGTVGWSFVGLEYSSEIASQRRWSLSATLRIPLGVILYALDAS